jgi:hypothetical protein
MTWIQVVGWGLALLVPAIGAYWKRRHEPRRETAEAAEKAEAEHKSALQRKTAFRGLYSFREDEPDDIPGEVRQREADQIATAIRDEHYSFGVVSGETGSGKSSLLANGVCRRLRQAGVPVVLVPSPRQLRNSSGEAVSTVAALGKILKDRAKAAQSDGSGPPVVMIIDQFEELLIDYAAVDPAAPSVRPRNVLAKALAQLTAGSPKDRLPVKIVCAVRKDYLLDLHDLSPAIPEPLATKSLFHIQNFTRDEAEAVIAACAARDGIAITPPGLSATIADGLAEKGLVRPPELQIVCTALKNALTEDNYRRAGGATGILSEHIKSALAGCPNQTLGRRLLRELCDFSARAKKDPQSADQLLALVTGAGPALPPDLLTRTLSHLENARLVRSEPAPDGRPRYALAQDYLVDAVNLATQDVSTRAEEAEQIVTYYINQNHGARKRWGVFPHAPVPGSRVRFIWRNARPGLLARPDVKSLLKRSRWYARLSTAALGGVVVVAALALSMAATFERSYRLKHVERHWPAQMRGPVAVRFVPAPGADGTPAVMTRSISLTGLMDFAEVPPHNDGGVQAVPAPRDRQDLPFSDPFGTSQYIEPSFKFSNKYYVRLWDAEEARLTGFCAGQFLSNSLDDTGAVLLERTAGEALGSLRYATRSPGSLDLAVPLDVDLSKAPGTRQMLAQAGNTLFVVRESAPNSFRWVVQSFTLPRGEKVAEFSLGEAYNFEFYPLRSGTVLFQVNHRRPPPPDAKDTRGEDYSLELIVLPRGAAAPKTLVERSSFEVNTFGNDIVITSPEAGMAATLSPSEGRIRRWNVESPDLPTKDYTLAGLDGRWLPRAVFTGKGKYILIQAYAVQPDVTGTRIAVLDSAELKPARQFPIPFEQALERVWWAGGRGADAIAWPANDSVYLWDFEKDPKKLDGLKPDELFSLVLSTDRKRLLAGLNGGQMKLWDLEAGTRNELKVPGGVWWGRFSLDDRACFVRTEQGTLAVFDAASARPLASLDVGGEGDPLAYYDPQHGRINVWTADGRVLCYEKGWTTWLSRLRGAVDPYGISASRFEGEPEPDAAEKSQTWNTLRTAGGTGSR